MVQMLDTEGDRIPKGICGAPLFDVDLVDWGKGKGPELTLSIPECFEGSDGRYEGAGVVVVPLKAVLEEYLEEFEFFDDTDDRVERFAEWLHNYADKLLTKYNEVAQKAMAERGAKMRLDALLAIEADRGMTEAERQELRILLRARKEGKNADL